MMKQNKTKNTQIKIQSSRKCSENSPQISKIVFWLFVSLSPMIASCDARSRECFTHVSNCAEYFLPCKIYTRTISKLTQWLFPFWCVTSKWLNVIKKAHGNFEHLMLLNDVRAGVRMCKFWSKSAVTRLTTAWFFSLSSSSSSFLRFAPLSSALLCSALFRFCTACWTVFFLLLETTPFMTKKHSSFGTQWVIWVLRVPTPSESERLVRVNSQKI